MTERTIILKGKGIRKEGNAGGAVTPGHLVMRASDGDIEVHGTAADTAAAQFAVENELEGNTISDAYAAGDRIFFEHCVPGQEVYALVAASAAAIVIGDKLESAGDGTLRKQASDVATDQSERGSVVAQALEAVDNSGGGSAARIKVEIL